MTNLHVSNYQNWSDLMAYCHCNYELLVCSPAGLRPATSLCIGASAYAHARQNLIKLVLLTVLLINAAACLAI